MASTAGIIIGILFLIVGIAAFFEGYNSVNQCGTFLGQLGNAIAPNSIIATIMPGIQITCSNAAMFEILGAILGVVGLILLFISSKK